MRNVSSETVGKAFLVKMAKNLAELCSSALWKEELWAMKLDIIWDFWAKCSWSRLVPPDAKGERGIEEGIVKQKGTRIWRFENSQPTCIVKYEKASSKKSTMGVARQPFDNKFMGLSEQEHCRFELKEMEMGQNEESFWTSWIWQDGMMKLCDCERALFFKKREKWPQRWFRGHQGYCLSFSKS